jgi:hypothetical protein
MGRHRNGNLEDGMKRLAAKFAFVHRTLWQRDQAYRWTVLLGPPPLFGCAVAALAWVAIQQFQHGATVPSSAAPWAHWTRPVPQAGQPYTEAPAAALPRTDASGRFVGFQPGWMGEIRPMSVDATMDTNVFASVLTNFTIDGPTVPLARILAAGPSTGLFVGTTETYFVAQTPGIYAFSVQFAWSGAQSADCAVRFGSANHRMVRNTNLNISSQSILSYAPTEFRLEPGLFLLQTAVGCWHGDHVMGPGTLTVMVRHPGELVLTPAAADELMRPVPRGNATSGR